MKIVIDDTFIKDFSISVLVAFLFVTAIVVMITIIQTVIYNRHCKMCHYKTRNTERPMQSKESYVKMTFEEFMKKFSIEDLDMNKMNRKLSCYVYPISKTTDLVLFIDGPYLSIRRDGISEIVYIMFFDKRDLMSYRSEFDMIKFRYKNTFNNRVTMDYLDEKMYEAGD